MGSKWANFGVFGGQKHPFLALFWPLLGMVQKVLNPLTLVV